MAMKIEEEGQKNTCLQINVLNGGL